MIVQRATVFEYFQIEGMRAAYYAERDLPVARRADGTVWLIAREGPRVVACTSYLDVASERIMQDFYCVDGRIGMRGLYALRDEVFRQADADAIRLNIVCEPDNLRMLRAYGWTLTLKPNRHAGGQGLVAKAVIMVREPARRPEDP